MNLNVYMMVFCSAARTWCLCHVCVFLYNFPFIATRRWLGADTVYGFVRASLQLYFSWEQTASVPAPHSAQGKWKMLKRYLLFSKVFWLHKRLHDGKNVERGAETVCAKERSMRVTTVERRQSVRRRQSACSVCAACPFVGLSRRSRQ